MQKRKLIIIIISVLLCACLVFGVIGLLENKKNSNQKKPVQRNYQITYKYYLNDVEVAQVPTNPTFISEDETGSSSSKIVDDAENLYSFNTYSCTNKVTGKWNDETWSFEHSNTADATCSLYFVTNYNTVKIELTNAKLANEKEKEKRIDRNEDAVFKVNPTEGYKFEKAECTNKEVVEWDEDAKELIVRSITSETTCKANFVVAKFTVETEVDFGTGTTSLEYEYGKKVEIKVEPASEYGNPEITCTNEQKGTWKDNQFVIEKITNNTKCSIKFTKLQSKVQFTVSLDVGSNGLLVSGESSRLVLSGADVSWSVRPNEGYTIKTDPSCTAGKPSVKTSGNDFIITLKEVDQDATCTVIYEKVTSQEQPSTTVE